MTQLSAPLWTPDASQQRVIDALGGGYHLVLAPPGCGKTQILTERIRRAHAQGVAYGDMLCLTFTNRAARGMRQRIAHYIDDEDVSDLYVGNIHRFCAKYLFENHCVPAETAVIDDDDALSILARYLNEEEDEVKANFNRRRGYAEIIHFAHFMHQVIHRHPRGLRLHPDCLTPDDVRALNCICRVERRSLTPESMMDIYDHTDYYRDAIRSDSYDVGSQQLINRLLYKMRYAHAFTAYCRQNQLMDFEDLLLYTYDALNGQPSHPRYRWIQVDEVQDLNSMQIALIDSVTHPGVATGQGMVMYLGDAQQAIFSFMGAQADTLTQLRRRCEGHIHHLEVNHRSPSYLLQVFNDYAADVLHVDRALLPVPSSSDDSPADGSLCLVPADTLETEYDGVARLADSLCRRHPGDTTAIVVTANSDADLIGSRLHQLVAPYFQVSGTDIFSTPEVKLLLAHLNVLAAETNFMAWARLLQGLGVFAAPASARAFVRKLLNRAILPSDLLLYEGTATYVQDFAATMAQAEVVVFDTETTGLSVFDDDILQIAAVKMRGGRVVEGSAFVVHIATDRPIPAMLGDVPNPIIEERRHQRLLSHEEALSQFVAYADGCVLVGHNVEYDYQILRHNLGRYLPGRDLSCHRRFDTLKLLRLFHPELSSYRLDDLRRQHLFGLCEDNAHLADVDVDDTCKVVSHLLGRSDDYIAGQRDFLAQASVAQRADVLRRHYRQCYVGALGRLYQRCEDGGDPALVRELRSLYRQLQADGYPASQQAKIAYILRYLSTQMITPAAEPSLSEQLSNHLMDINTLKEADLCGSGIIDERIFVSTVHKAKGLEFDNVIVFDTVDGRYPNYYNRYNPAACEEDKRKLYVALSRAKRRLFLAWSTTRVDYHGQPQPRELSPFLTPILRHFSNLSSL